MEASNSYQYKGENIPEWSANNKSLLRKCLTQEVWDALKDK